LEAGEPQSPAPRPKSGAMLALSGDAEIEPCEGPILFK
jgi:hypothetical protein